MADQENAETITSLARQYGVCRQTFSKWIKPFADLIQRQPGIRVFTPAQVHIIYEKLGRP